MPMTAAGSQARARGLISGFPPNTPHIRTYPGERIHHRVPLPDAVVDGPWQRAAGASPAQRLPMSSNETTRREWAEIALSATLVLLAFFVLPALGVPVSEEARIVAGVAATYLFGDGASDLARKRSDRTR